MSQKSTDKRLTSIEECLIVSNDLSTKKDIPDIITDLYYYESILNETVRVQLMYTDTGNTVKKGDSYKTLLEGMPLEREEQTTLRIKDSLGTELKLDLYINKITPMSKDTTKSLVGLELVSEEGITNYKSVLTKRYDGKISENVRKILTDSELLNTKKKLDIEETTNNHNFIGNQYRPFYALTWLAKKSIPKTPSAEGNTAGFFFFETSDGFKFKSIDGLLSTTEPSGGKKVIKSYAYNQTYDLPKGYSGKILDLVPPTPSGDIQTKLEAGTYSTRTILFNPFNCYYEVINPNSQGSGKGSESKLQKAGKNLPKGNPKFTKTGNNKDFSRTQYILLDTGTLPTGKGIGKGQEQVQKSKDQNFDPRNILNQSSMRYNQLFSSQTTITIDADFSLHAGDLIFIDTPELSNKESKQMDDQLGGYYLIADLCHYINIAEGGYTKIIAVRDSTGRKGNPTYNAI
jgi:hypothetical protein